MILRFALILSFVLAGPVTVLACVNAMRVDGDDAVKQIAHAERLLARGQLSKAERMVDPHEYRFPDDGLRAKASLVYHTAILRTVGVSQYRLKYSTEFVQTAWQNNTEDPVLISRNAEALALSEKTAGQAREALEDLVNRDLVPEAQSYVTLARLLSKAGEKAAADDALASCLLMTKFKTVCSLSPKKRRTKQNPRPRYRSKSRSRS